MNYSIQNEHLEITVRTYGAELISIKSKNQIEYIWQRNPEFWNRCAPILFPVVGRLRDKYTMIDNKKYSMDIHGFLKDQEFILLSRSNDHLSFYHKFTSETLEMYPFCYEAMISYFIKGNQVRTQFQITNISQVEMPFNIGAHPAINCPLYENEQFSDYDIEFEHPETFSSPTIEANGTLNFDQPKVHYHNLKRFSLQREAFFLDTIVIQHVKSQQVRLRNQANKGIIFRFPRFKTFAIWTRYHQNAPYICLEPWIGYGDRYDSNHNFLEKDDLVILKPQEDFSIYYDIELVE